MNQLAQEARAEIDVRNKQWNIAKHERKESEEELEAQVKKKDTDEDYISKYEETIRKAEDDAQEVCCTFQEISKDITLTLLQCEFNISCLYHANMIIFPFSLVCTTSCASLEK